MQIGLINIADSSDGYSIGLFNYVRKGGIHKLSLYTNEFMNTNLAIKTGNRKLYSILMGGMNISNSEKMISFGFGLGHEFTLSRSFSLSAEISSHSVYRGTWDYYNLLEKFNLNLTWQLSKNIAIFAGPSFNIYISDQPAAVAGYKYDLPYKNKNFDLGNTVNGWIGFSAGISLF